MTNRWVKNAAGVKNSADIYRTVDGVRWFWWADTGIEKLREHGLRCRKIGGMVFMHPDDVSRALQLVK